MFCRDIDPGRLDGIVRFVDERLHRYEVYGALELALLTDRQLDRDSVSM